MDPDTILLDAEERMRKAVDHLMQEFKGVRTGRASTALLETIKVEYYGSMTELKALAAVSVPEPSQLLVKPFDAGTVNEIKNAIENSDLGLNPQVDGKQLRVNVPPLSTERRKQLATHLKKVTEETKVSMRNVRRDANKHADGLKDDKDAHYPEDDVKQLKEEIQDLLKKLEKETDDSLTKKTAEVMEV